jgi:hypothetical protein
MRDTSDSGEIQAPVAAYQAAAAAQAIQSMGRYLVNELISWNASFGPAVGGSLMPDQGSIDAGIAGDTSGKVCMYVNVCMGGTVTKPPLWGSYGAAATFGHGELPESHSINMYGVVYSAGETFMGDGAIMRDEEGSYSVSRGYLGQVVSPFANEVYGAGMQACHTTYVACSK